MNKEFWSCFPGINCLNSDSDIINIVFVRKIFTIASPALSRCQHGQMKKTIYVRIEQSVFTEARDP